MEGPQILVENYEKIVDLMKRRLLPIKDLRVALLNKNLVERCILSHQNKSKSELLEEMAKRVDALIDDIMKMSKEEDELLKVATVSRYGQSLLSETR